MLTLHVRRSKPTPVSASRHSPASRSFAQTPARAVIDAAIHLLAAYPRLSEADIARGYPRVINITPRRAMH